MSCLVACAVSAAIASMSCNSFPLSASTQGQTAMRKQTVAKVGREKCKDHYRRERQKERMHREYREGHYAFLIKAKSRLSFWASIANS